MKRPVYKREENIYDQSLYLVTLDPSGEQLTSEGLAKFLADLEMQGETVVMVIGGSLGLSKELLAKARLKLSFSKLTYPHQLFRGMLLEQIYRVCKINRGERNHSEGKTHVSGNL